MIRVTATALLVMLMLSAMGQPKKALFTKSYIKTDTFCNHQYAYFLWTKRKIYLEIDGVYINVRVIKRRKYEWVAKDKFGKQYRIFSAMKDDMASMLILSNGGSVQISNYNVCDYVGGN